MMMSSILGLDPGPWARDWVRQLDRYFEKYLKWNLSSSQLTAASAQTADS